jgi:hypothetical protein
MLRVTAAPVQSCAREASGCLSPRSGSRRGGGGGGGAQARLGGDGGLDDDGLGHGLEAGARSLWRLAVRVGRRRAAPSRAEGVAEGAEHAPACGRDRASPKKYSPKIALNRRTLYRKPQKTPIASPRLVSPIKLELALSRAPALAAAVAEHAVQPRSVLVAAVLAELRPAGAAAAVLAATAAARASTAQPVPLIVKLSW